MKIYKDEIFGPVLVVLRAKTLDEAIALVNSNPYANGTAIFTESGGAARRFENEIQVGMVGVNVPIPVPVAFYSFGGWKGSLFGDLHVHGMEGVKFYTRTKVITTRWPHQDTPAPGSHADLGLIRDRRRAGCAPDNLRSSRGEPVAVRRDRCVGASQRGAPRVDGACSWGRHDVVGALPDGCRRLYFRHDAAGLPRAEAAQAALARHVPGARIREVVNRGAFRIHRRMADRFRVGRVLLAGDAAHVCSPSAGVGMNAGMQDSANLAWKLGLVVPVAPPVAARHL